VDPLTIVVVVAIVLVVVLLLWLVVIYNRLIRARNAYKNGFAQIDVQLTRRHDLIPNLVESVKGYIKHERETLEAVTAARAAAVTAQGAAKAAPGDPTAMQELAGAENLLTQMLGRMFALSEAYPDLKASQNVLQLQEELASTENRVAFARQAFNDSVMTYNNVRETFPANMVAGAFRFERAALLEIDAEQRDVPRASF
jgi:LemA protein